MFYFEELDFYCAVFPNNTFATYDTSTMNRISDLIPLGRNDSNYTCTKAFPYYITSKSAFTAVLCQEDKTSKFFFDFVGHGANSTQRYFYYLQYADADLTYISASGQITYALIN